MDRRAFLKSLGYGIGFFSLVGCGSSSTKSIPSTQTSSAQGLSYGNDTFPLPRIASSRYVDGKKVIRLNIQEGLYEFFPGISTRTFGINQDFLGQTILLEEGEDVSLEFFNGLDERTTMHGHGMHVPAVMDGGPHQIIEPGEIWRAEYKVKQQAATNWYHTHLMGETARQVYMGLAGFIIIKDKLELPKEYGVDDIPLVLMERRFDENGEIDYSPTMQEIMQGYRGGELLVNGEKAPMKKVSHSFVRLRILNGSNASVFHIAFDNRFPFYLIAGDNSFLTSPSLEEELVLSPGERAEVVVELRGVEGERLRLLETDSMRTILTLDVASKLQDNIEALPQHLIEFEPMETPVYTRRFVLGMQRMQLTINGKTMDMNRIDERVPVGRPEIWEIVNPTMMEHNFHIHATHFRLLERNGSAANLRPHERCYKDTVYLAPGDRVKFYVKMMDYVDAKNPYMYHCHFLEHEDNGMMGQFVVI